MTITRPILAALAAFLLLIPAASAQTTANEQPTDEQPTDEQRLTQAEAAYERAILTRTTDPDESERALAEARAAFADLIDRGYHNADLYRNLGNTHLLAGDVGRAVLNFRRAERLRPTDEAVRQSLAEARAAVRSAVTPDLANRAATTLFFWRGLVPRTTIFWSALLLWTLAFAALSVGFAGRSPALRRVGLITLALALLAAASLALERTAGPNQNAAVIIEDGVTGYRGPSPTVYEPTFEQPIRAGVEGIIEERRAPASGPAWVRLRLPSGMETWLPESAIERVQESPRSTQTPTP